MAESDEVLIGGFRLLAKLKADAGMQGTVYRAVCETDDFPRCPRGTVVALKTMSACGEDCDRAYERLRTRTDILKGIDHPNLVKYYGCFTEQQDFSEIHVVVEELLEGETLKDRLVSYPNGLDADEAVRIVTAMVAGLGAAEAKGVAHRDVKPANVFLCKDGSVKIIDFEVGDSTGSTVSTVSGNMVGSFDYMAPDFTDPHFIGDELSDVFSAGVVMHEVFSGRLPYPRFPGDSRQANFAFLERWPRDANGDFPKNALTVSSRVERFVAHAKQVLLQALEPRRDRRLPSFAAFSAALASIRFRDLHNGAVSYRMLQLIGKGGFGEVFKARSGGRTVAVKHLLKPEYASRFYREAKIMSELNEPCFVRFFDFFVLEHAGRKEAFLVMDYLPGMPGSSLRDAIRKSAGCGLDYDSVLRAFIRYAHGLKVIHEKGVFHRDIKPSNLYYPEDRPGDSTIMDLGIARETDGTETTGQVPGTLDYMPPETAMTGTRGDASMDVYALGLCLYEALTGKKGFPRLPTGSAAYAQFFKRAREKTRPVFDDERVAKIPGLLKLITWMTEPEAKDRLSDAGRLEEELANLRDGKPMPADEPKADEASTEAATVVVAAASETAAEQNDAGDDDSETCETAFVAPTEIAKAAQAAIHSHIKRSARDGKPSASRRIGRHVAIWTAVAALGGVAFAFRSVVSGWVGDIVGMCNRVLEPGVSSPAPVMLGQADDLGVPDLYGDSGITLEEADVLRDRWLEERKPPAHSKSEYDRLAGILASYREQRIIRDRLAADRSRIESELKQVVETYRTEGVAAGDAKREAWFKTWKSATKEKTSEAVQAFAKARNERLRRDELMAVTEEAAAAAAKVARSYSANGTKIADRESVIWRNEWKDRLPQDDFVRLCKTIAEARDRQLRKLAWERRQTEAKALRDECLSLCDMVEPVDSRSSRLDEAELRLKQGRAGNLIDEKAAGEIAAEIERRRSWVVFGIVNNTDHELEIDGIRLKVGESHVFTYTNAPPEQLAATSVGFEPLPLGRQTNGKTLRLLPEHFTMLKVAVKAEKLPEGVACHVDGRPVTSGEIKLLPGSHECLYTRKDYRSQTIPFRLEPGTPSALPPPEEWLRTEEWTQRERNKARAQQVAVFEAAFRAKLADDPVETRVSRLEDCRKTLEGGKAEELLGKEKLAALRDEWAKANTRGVGLVDNRAGIDFVVHVDGQDVGIRNGTCTRIEFVMPGTGELTLQKKGYAPIRLPRDFNGKKMVVMPSHVEPVPVMVSLPKLPAGTTCSFDGGAAVTADVELAPGSHVCVFSRPDYQDIQHDFTVTVGEPMTLPTPTGWKAGEALGHLIAAETAADAGDWNGVREKMAISNVAGEESLKRKLALSVRLRRHEQFAIRRDKAAEAIREARWSDAINDYSMLWLDGCELTEKERSHANEAADKALENARFQLKLAKRSKDKKRIEGAEKELQTLRTQIGVLRVSGMSGQPQAGK